MVVGVVVVVVGVVVVAVAAAKVSGDDGEIIPRLPPAAVAVAAVDVGGEDKAGGGAGDDFEDRRGCLLVKDGEYEEFVLAAAVALRDEFGCTFSTAMVASLLSLSSSSSS